MGIVIIGFLIGFPLLIGLSMLVIRNDRLRGFVVVPAVLLLAAGTIVLAIFYCTGSVTHFDFQSGYVTYATLVVDVLVCLFIVYMGIRYKRPLALTLALLQTLAVLVYELLFAEGIRVKTALYIDNLSIVMALVIGVVGGVIVIYALGYMKDHAEHDPEQRDKRPLFFGVIFLFLSAMFAVVFCNDLNWLFCAWEVTTVCSFYLIGYTRTEEAIDSAFRQVVFNLFGGLAFTAAILIAGSYYGTLELDALVRYGGSGFALLPLALLAFAGMTKAAQMPFQSWLLGAMVAPTPVSALLHSSTMVKAGVFLIIKLSSALGWNLVGIMVMMVGGITFLCSSLMAVTQSDAKRVLAYSTISTLGLIIACAGVGSPGAVWAAIFLLVFHAVAKSLLFLCVGTAEHHIGSRDIEDMDYLFERMPALARFMSLGILLMFIAPFGMLISKWAALVAVVDSQVLGLLLMLCFGSAATFMFWAKWLGKVTAIAVGHENIEKETVHGSEWFSLTLLAILSLLLCISLPVLSNYVVDPYLLGSFGIIALYSDMGIDIDDLFIMSFICVAVIILFLAFYGRTGKRRVNVYLSGVGVDMDERSFIDSLSGETVASQRNWYLSDYFGEARIAPVGNWTCAAIQVVSVALSLCVMGGLF